MSKSLLHRPALSAVLTLATSPVRWRTQSQLASAVGVTPSTFSNALAGRRGLSDDVLASLGETLGIDAHAALLLPVPARPHDFRVDEELREIRELQDRVTDLWHAVTERAQR